jgi:hypothetical protein
MQKPAKFLGMVRVWKDGDQWKYVPAGKWAPEHAELAKRYRAGDEEIISIERRGSGEFVRGAVKGE